MVEGGENPQGEDWRMSKNPPGDAVLLTLVRSRQRKTHHNNQTWPELKRRKPPQNDEQREPELGLGLYGIADGMERGKRPRIGIS